MQQMKPEIENLYLRRQILELQAQILHLQHQQLTAEIERIEAAQPQIQNVGEKNEQDQG